MMLHGRSNTIKSFLPIFYLSKYFGCNLYPLPKVLSASNVKLNLRAIDVLICLIQFGLTFGITIPLITKWSHHDSAIRKDLESLISLSSVVTLTMAGSFANYAFAIISSFIVIIDIFNAPVIRSFLLFFTKIDEQVKHIFELI